MYRAHNPPRKYEEYAYVLDFNPRGKSTTVRGREGISFIRPTSLAELRSFTFGWKKLILAETLAKILKIIKEHS